MEDTKLDEQAQSRLLCLQKFLVSAGEGQALRDSQPQLGIIIIALYCNSLGSHEALSIGRQPVVFGFLMFNSSLTWDPEVTLENHPCMNLTWSTQGQV